MSRKWHRWIGLSLDINRDIYEKCLGVAWISYQNLCKTNTAQTEHLTVKNVADFPVPSRDVTSDILAGNGKNLFLQCIFHNLNKKMRVYYTTVHNITYFLRN
jgi:hypothetical protein